MKQHYTSTFRAVLFAATFLSLVFTSCRRDEYSGDNEMEQSLKYLTIDKAKQLVGRIAPQATKSSTNADSALLPANYSALWDQAREESQGVLEAVEIPIAGSRELYAIDKQGRKSRVEQRILVADGEKFSWTEGYVMTIIPDADYTGELWSVKHAGDKRDFSGVILFHSLRTGQFVRIDHYEAGKSVKHIYTPIYKNINFEILHQEVDEILDCTKLFYAATVTRRGVNENNQIGDVIIWGNRPNTDSNHGGGGGIGGGGGGGSASGWNGAENFEVSSIQCPFEGGRDEGVGGGGGFTTPINSVFKNINLSDFDVRQINAALNSLKKRCMSKGLVEIMASSNIPIEYWDASDPLSFASFGGPNSSLKITPRALNAGGDDLQNALLHELFHAYNYINYYDRGLNIGNEKYKLVSEFMAYTFVNLHYGYNLLDQRYTIPPPSENRPWVGEYLNKISEMTQGYRKKITPEQLQTLYNNYSENFREYAKIPKVANEVVNLDPLNVLLNDVLKDCISFE